MTAYLQRFLHQFKHLEIRLDEIKSATDNFNSDNCIGVRGYGKVYKGEVSHYRGRSMVAIKRLDSSSGQGAPEFLKEITTLSRYNHENLISLVGFCCQGEEMIVVYEHASRGSLDRYLNSPRLTWPQRIKICLGAAKGLGYLHDPGETHQRLIHCDIKSANILLDDRWNAKVSDLGLSVMGSANEQQSVIITLAAGTRGYCDPEYVMTHTLTKESDAYSFGVVLFEVLCGKLCYRSGDGRTQKILLPMWIESYEQNKLNDIIFKSSTVQPLDQSTLKKISDIAYRCLNAFREGRPMMTEVITELKTALEHQEFSERKLPFDYEEVTRSAEPPLTYSSKFELWKLLFTGVLLNYGKTWFSLNNQGEHCEMISFAECLVSGPGEFKPTRRSRFAFGSYHLLSGEKCKVRVKNQFLSPGVTYTMDLVLRKTELKRFLWVTVTYKLEGKTETLNSKLVYKSDDGYWWKVELYQFTNDQRDDEIVFEFSAACDIKVDGIDFRPVEEVEYTTTEESIADWEERLPPDYEEAIRQSKNKNTVPWTTKKEAYAILRNGLLFDHDDTEIWFFLDNNGNSSGMLPARAFLKSGDLGGIIQSSPESRFGKALECNRIPDVASGPERENLSRETKYSLYLVYKLSKRLEINHPVLVEDGMGNYWYVYLVSPETPVIRTKGDQDIRNPMNRRTISGLPRQRDDGWMEVQIWEFHSSYSLYMGLSFYKAVPGLIVEGFEWRSV